MRPLENNVVFLGIFNFTEGLLRPIALSIMKIQTSVIAYWLNPASQLFILMFGVILFSSCKKNIAVPPNTVAEVVIEVNPSYFLTAGLSQTISKETRTFNGTSIECYKIITNNTPTDHAMGPWCPTNILDGADKGGVWFEGGKLYDVDGSFIKNMASFYNSTTWQLYNTATGKINVTDTKDKCEAAARPNVDPAYRNFCVECQPSYYQGLKKIFYIPVKPQKASNTMPIMGMGMVVGIAFNGINFDPPAPTQAILGAFTLAPMDDAGGHVNGAVGYHYHAATGKSTSIKQTDGHASMIGYAMDGYGMFQQLDASGKEPADLDANRGHYDTVRGYHYHVASAGSNKFINGFRGLPGSFSVSF